MNPRLAQLVDAYLLEELTPEMDEELLALLDSDDHLQDFVRDTHLHHQLRDLLIGGESSIADELWAKDLPNPAEIRRAVAAAPPVPPSQKWSQPLAVVLAALLFYGTFIAVAWNLQPGPADAPEIAERGTRTPAEVALLAMQLVDESADCEWEIPPAATSNGIVNAQREFRLRRGVARFAFGSGAVVRAEGPARFQAISAGRMRLIDGKLTAKVPPRAIGFTVETPTVTVVDLGTEFTVEANAYGESEVRVLAGKVQILPVAFTGGGAAAEILLAGESRKFSVPVMRGPRRLPVGGAMASSEFSHDRGVNYVINGGGLTGESHTNEPAYAMWHSVLGKVAGEFLLFDLVRPYRLHAIKVWNYNEAASDLFRARGVKQADIYVSTSGKGNPLSHATEWRLAVADHQFHPADGTSDYATPDEVTLGEAEARFVAIVIDDCFADDPRSPGVPKTRCVGLGEVQFFGERIDTENSGKQDAS